MAQLRDVTFSSFSQMCAKPTNKAAIQQLELKLADAQNAMPRLQRERGVSSSDSRYASEHYNHFNHCGSQYLQHLRRDAESASDDVPLVQAVIPITTIFDLSVHPCTKHITASQGGRRQPHKKSFSSGANVWPMLGICCFGKPLNHHGFCRCIPNSVFRTVP